MDLRSVHALVARQIADVARNEVDLHSGIAQRRIDLFHAHVPRVVGIPDMQDLEGCRSHVHCRIGWVRAWWAARANASTRLHVYSWSRGTADCLPASPNAAIFSGDANKPVIAWRKASASPDGVSRPVCPSSM